MAQQVFQTSFAGGELSPNLYAREDIEKYQSGAALMRNFYVDYRGGASNRPGTEFKAQCYADTLTRLIPFIFSTDQSYVLELSGQHMRVYKQGVAVADLSTPWLGADLFFLKFVQSADVMTLVHPAYPPYNLSRTSLTTFTLDLTETGPTVVPPANALATPSNAGALNYGYTITAINSAGEESLGSFPAVGDSVALDPTNATPKTIAVTWDAVSGAAVYNIYKWGPVPDDQPLPTLFGYCGQTKTTSFTDTNIAADYSRTPPEFRDPFSPGQITAIDVASGGSGYAGYVELTITGDGAGADAYAVADGSGAITGVVLVNTGHDYTTATVMPVSGAATFTATVDAEDHYPSVVTYYQQRRVFGGADITPELLEFSQIGAYENFDVSPAVLDTDAITVNIASRQVNDIKALVPMSTGLIVFTTGCAFLVAGAGDSSVVTPSSVSAVPQASTGSNDIPPITVNYNILFVQQKGAIVRDMAFSFQTQSYYGVDRSMLANHLFFGYSIVDWAWAEEPYKLLWVVRNDGRCLVMTYVPDQEVYGWSQHDTNGLFKSVCTVPEGDQDATYFVVRRFIQETQTWRNYFERLAFRTCDCPADAAFLDSFASLEGVRGQLGLLISVDGNDVTVTQADNQTSTVGGFTMEAKQNYATTQQDQVNLQDSTLFDDISASQTFTGDSFDPISRNFLYACCMGHIDDQIVPYDLWDGATLISAGDSFDDQNGWNFFTLEKSIDTGAVTSYEAYSSSRLVPVSVGQGSETRRYMDTADGAEVQLRRLIDPRTANMWQHTYGNDYPCGMMLLRKSANYQQEISPIEFVGHMEIVGLTEDWLYYIRKTNNAHNYFDEIALTPRDFTAEEITQDYLLNYAEFTLPAATHTAYYRWTLMADKTAWFFSVTQTGARQYELYKFEPPTAAPYGGPVVGGGITLVTPWDATHGPNTSVAGYTLNGAGSMHWNKNIAFSIIRAADTADTVACISKFFPCDHTVNSHDPSLFRMDCTFIRTDTLDFSYHEKFIYGYMKADWTVAADLSEAAYVVIDCQEVNNYLNYNAFDYFPYSGTIEPGQVYNVRHFFFTVQKVVDGAWTYDAAENHTVIVVYSFTYGNPPSLFLFYDEDLWYNNYAYTGFSHPMNRCMNALNQNADIFMEWGLYDYQTRAWWWGGDQQNGAMAALDPTYLNRGISEIPESSYPLLKIATGPVAGEYVDLGCGTIRVTGNTGNAYGDITGFTGVIVNSIEQFVVPDDPFHTIRPIEAGYWFIISPASQIAVPHLIGMNVGLVVDGQVYPEQIVPPSGLITWPVEYATTRAVCGLPYQCQLKTLYLSTGEPTTQGKMKLIPQVIIRVICTLGIKAGWSFDDLVEVKECMVIPYDVPEANFTGDTFPNIFNNWNTYGQICIQQDYPLPATILGLLPQLVLGDNQR